jgi:uncharacterized repeat protein (TIGR02543 family)
MNHQTTFTLLGVFMVAVLLGGCASAPATFTITFHANEGEGAAPTDGRTYVSGATAILPNQGELTRSGYVFAGWNTQEDGNGINYPVGSGMTIGASNITLYATWQWVPSTFTITYHANEGSGDPGVDNNRYATGATAIALLPGSLARTPGYTFAGWNTQPDGSGITFPAGSGITIGESDITLYAKWTRPLFFRAENGITIMCPDAANGAIGIVDGVVYTKRTYEGIRADPSAASTSCTSGIEDMSRMFWGRSFNEDISTWDTSNVMNMAGMFEESTFNRDISAWDTSNVTDMSYMFFYVYSFNQDLSGWDVANVTNCSSFANSAWSWTAPMPAFAACSP